ncbi:MAG TPA: aromatic ring-hydroxylating dioxygenase subunit alpha [Steroidobacteraceae bacterium]|nr:aromatic ring-hydroxylating dioxygenase subunit alpha [Steroidobacteraceae bacterium]
MSTGDPAAKPDDGYAGLTRLTEGLPAADYTDPARYQRELTQIWHENWVYVCRSTELPLPRSYRTFELGQQSLFLVRDAAGEVRGYYNTCRHRGAALCRNESGRFPSAGIVCPYHGWRYGLHGQLLQSSSLTQPEGFRLEDYPLYEIPVTVWNGCVFVALTDQPPPFGAAFDQPLGRLDRWHLGDLVVGHQFRKTIACNWKIFWENYNECLHCPGVHPRLSSLVPIFGRGLQDEKDDPHWRRHAGNDDPKYRGGLRRGAQSWTLDGRPVGVAFPDLTAADRALGQVYVTCLPSAFIVGHVDYVRIVRLRPLAPEQTELSVEFLFLPETLQDPARDISGAVEFTKQVMQEDADVCEINQRGLHSSPHRHGVLMAEEYLVAGFQDWVRRGLE